MKKICLLKKSANLSSLIFIFVILLYTISCKGKTELEKGIDFLEKGNYAEAVVSLEKTLVRDSLNPELHYSLGLAYAHLDSMDACYFHYLKLAELGSDLKDNIEIKIILAQSFNIEPYATSRIPMKRMHQFKGSFHPNGKTVVVAAAKRDRADLYLLALDGKVEKKLTKRGMNTDPVFSPDGEYIAYVTGIDGDDEIYLYHLRTEESFKLTDNKAKDFFPSFSPDGKEIAFISNMHNPYKWEIYKIQIDKKRIKRLTKNDYWDGFPKFSSDGKWIVYSSKRNGSEDIYRMKTNGGGDKVIYSTPADENDPVLIGDNLFFKSNTTGSWEIFQYNIKTKELIQLTYNDYPDWNPRISPDGYKLLITRKVKKKWRLYYADFSHPISSDVLVDLIEKHLGIEKKEEEKEVS